MPNLAKEGNRLQPSEAFLDPLSLPLADLVTLMPSRALINRTAAIPFEVLGHMRCDLHVATLGHELRRVKALVPSHRQPPLPQNLLQHQQRRVALRPPVGLPHHRVHNQSVSVLHQQIAAVAQFRFLALALTRQLRFRIGFRFVRPVRPILAMEVHGRIAGIIVGRRIRSVLPLKTFRAPAHASSNVPSTVKCSSEVKPFSRACSTTSPRNSLATSASSSRSRFLVNTVASQTSSSRFSPTNQRNKML